MLWLDESHRARSQAHNKKFQAEFPSNSGTWKAVMLECSSPVHAPTVHNRWQIRSGQYRMVLKDTPRRMLDLRFLAVHSRPLREHKIFAHVNHCFIVVFLFKSLDELILGFSMNSIVLCRSSGKPSDFNQGHQLCTLLG